jgi:hypothetical protein
VFSILRCLVDDLHGVEPEAAELVDVAQIALPPMDAPNQGHASQAEVVE